MIDDRYVEEGIRRGLRAIAPDQTPSYLLAETLEQTREMAQVSSNRAWRSVTSRSMPLAFVSTGLVIAIVAVGLGFGFPRQVPLDGPIGLTVGAVWLSDPTPEMTIERDPSDDRAFYWRVAMYDRIEAHRFSGSRAESVLLATGVSLPQGSAQGLDRPNLRPFMFTVVPEPHTPPFVVSPGTLLTVDQPVRLATFGRDGDLAAISLQGDGAYTATARVPDGVIAEASELRAAGTTYPPELSARYTAQENGTFGPNLQALRDEIVRTSASAAPYDLAERLVTVLRGGTYTYDTDLRDIDCGTMPTGECFAATKHGYCEHFAMTMALVLRDLDVPTRVVMGFLPGDRTNPSTEIIRRQDAHTWVEVFFPGVGWVAFDPTPRGVPTQVPLP